MIIMIIINQILSIYLLLLLGIGVWEDAIQIMSVVGVITNCGLLGITSNVIRSYYAAYSTTFIALWLFALEHAVLLFKYILHTAIPALSSSV